MDDQRLDALIASLNGADDSFANNMIWKAELLAVLQEVKRERDRPSHCPGCDGDHI